MEKEKICPIHDVIQDSYPLGCSEGICPKCQPNYLENKDTVKGEAWKLDQH